MTSLFTTSAPQLPTELLVECIRLSLPRNIAKEEDWKEHATSLTKYSLVSRIWRQIAQGMLYERIVVHSATAANRLCRTFTGQYSQRRDLAPLCQSLRFDSASADFDLIARDLRFNELLTLMAEVEELELRGLRDVVPWDWMRCTKLRQLRLEGCYLVKSMGEGPPRVTSNIQHLLLVNTDLFAGAFPPKAYPKLSFLSLGVYRAPHIAETATQSLVKDFAPQISAFRVDELSVHLVRDWKPRWKALQAYGVRLWAYGFEDGSQYADLDLPQKISLRHLYLEDPMLPSYSKLSAWEAHAALVVELLETDPILPSLSAIKTIRLPGHPDLTGGTSEVSKLLARLATLGEEKDIEISWTTEVEEGETDEVRGVWTKDDLFLRFVKSLDGQS